MTEQQSANTRVLMIDDNRTDVVVVKWLFEHRDSQQHVLHHVTTLDEGINYISNHDVDIVLLDQILPDSSADESFATLHGKFPDMPVVILSTTHDHAMLTARMQEGAVDYLLKSNIGHDLLFQTIDHAIECQRTARQAKKAESDERRREYLQSLGMLAGGVAHDLNNALGPLTSLPEVIEEDIEEFIDTGDTELVDNIKEDLEFMKASAERAAGIAKDLMGLSRRGRYDEHPIDLNSTITKYLDSQDFAFLVRSAPNVAIRKNLSHSKPVAMADAQQLTRVLSNLLLNASEAADDTGEIVVETAIEDVLVPREGYDLIEPGTYTVLRIRDDGPGIPDDVQARMFEPFYSTKPRGGRTGTGLGLAVVLGIVHDHKGRIDIESAPGEGTVFTIYMPSVETGPREAAPSISTGTPHGNGQHILVVDDEQVARHTACRILSNVGYRITEAENGHQAVDLVKDLTNGKAPFDLILLDMIMEIDFDGLAAMKKIQEIAPSQEIIIVSGYSHETNGKEAIQLGAGWLTKPFTKKRLLETVSVRLAQGKTRDRVFSLQSQDEEAVLPLPLSPTELIKSQ